jgi:ribose 5-phosphate isomerase A
MNQYQTQLSSKVINTSSSELMRQKRAVAECAVDYVQAGMRIGLGPGSTVAIAMAKIAERIATGQLSDITCVPCSREVSEHAVKLDICVGSLDQFAALDLTLGGADEVDSALDLISGVGGALFHEKMVAQASRRVMILVDASKPSQVLGSRKALPVEVVEFGWLAQVRYLESLGARVQLRSGPSSAPYRTEEGHRVLDCYFGPIQRPRDLAAQLEARAGIVAHGLFLGLATDVLIGSRECVYLLSRDHSRTTEGNAQPLRSDVIAFTGATVFRHGPNWAPVRRTP